MTPPAVEAAHTGYGRTATPATNAPVAAHFAASRFDAGRATRPTAADATAASVASD